MEAKGFFYEALGLIVSYLSSRSVELNAVASFDINDEDDDFHSFLNEIEIRHNIAYLNKLQPILETLIKKLSTKPRLVKEFSGLPINGRLDVNKYVASGKFMYSGDVLYPTIKSDISFSTPENILISNVLRHISRQLSTYKLKTNTAESLYVNMFYEWIHLQLRNTNWSLVESNQGYDRLAFETKRRLLKRQTGNQQGYQNFISWYDEWRVKGSKLNPNQEEEIAKSILAFPTSSSFDEKIFEIWCLQYIVEVLVSIGFVVIEGPYPLHKRSESYIYKLHNGEVELLIWFQKMEPIGKPRWYYTGAMGKAFNGIPDVVITSNQVSSPLVIDAKYRMMEKTKAEETYKMLGYFENFRNSFPGSNFIGILLFIGNEHNFTNLKSTEGASVSLLSVPILNHKSSTLGNSLSRELKEWLKLSKL
ncbi:hypothetical protein OB13_20670 [Pontibacter sp. HJ8]